MENGQPQGRALSQSALTAAAARAAHLIVDKEPYIFSDTLAAALLGEQADELLSYHQRHGAHPVLAGARAQAASRGRHAEDRLAEAAGRGVRQYVILGAGLDTFAYRSPLVAGLRIFEVDHPVTQDWKRRALGAAGIVVPDTVTFVPADLASTGPAGAGLLGTLGARGLDLAAPAFVSWLGVIMYLTPADVAATFTVLGGLAPGSEVVADYLLAPGSRDETGGVYADLVSQASAERGEPWLSSFEPAELTTLATAAGFGGVRHVRQRDAIPAALWERGDSLTPTDLFVLVHAAIAGA